VPVRSKCGLARSVTTAAGALRRVASRQLDIGVVVVRTGGN